MTQNRDWEKTIREWNCKHTPGEYGSGCQCLVDFIQSMRNDIFEAVEKEVLGVDREIPMRLAIKADSDAGAGYTIGVNALLKEQRKALQAIKQTK